MYKSSIISSIFGNQNVETRNGTNRKWNMWCGKNFQNYKIWVASLQLKLLTKFVNKYREQEQFCCLLIWEYDLNILIKYNKFITKFSSLLWETVLCYFPFWTPSSSHSLNKPYVTKWFWVDRFQWLSVGMLKNPR